MLQTPDIGDAYFLESGDKIRYFFETAAFTNGELNRPKELAVNKIGHALHELDDVYRDFTLENDDLITLVKELEFHKDPRGTSFELWGGRKRKLIDFGCESSYSKYGSYYFQ